MTNQQYDEIQEIESLIQDYLCEGLDNSLAFHLNQFPKESLVLYLTILVQKRESGF